MSQKIIIDKKFRGTHHIVGATISCTVEGIKANHKSRGKGMLLLHVRAKKALEHFWIGSERLGPLMGFS